MHEQNLRVISASGIGYGTGNGLRLMEFRVRSPRENQVARLALDVNTSSNVFPPDRTHEAGHMYQFECRCFRIFEGLIVRTDDLDI